MNIKAFMSESVHNSLFKTNYGIESVGGRPTDAHTFVD